MQASEDRDRDDFPGRACAFVATRLLAPRNLRRGQLPQALMRARFHGLADVLSQHSPQVVLAEDEDVVEALAPHGAKEALANGVHPGCPHGGLRVSPGLPGWQVGAVIRKPMESRGGWRR